MVRARKSHGASRGARPGRAAGRDRSAAPVTAEWLFGAVVVLLCMGLGSSVYLGALHLKVTQAGGGHVDSFCALSEGFNCVTVASSHYSVFLGIPLALYGIEFFFVTLFITLLSHLRWWVLRRWDSLLFFATGVSVPVCVALAWISARHIHSLCIVCIMVYTVVLLVFLLLLLSARGRVRGLLTEGPRELWRLLGSARQGAPLLAVALLFFSQLFWVPRLLGARESFEEAFKNVTRSGQTLGATNAKVRIEEFTDFQCPFCGQAHRVMMEVMRRFAGRVQLIHRDFPLDQACNPSITRPFHGQACRAAVFARCAAQQDRYWPYEALLFESRDSLEDESLERFARKVQIDLGRLRTCVQGPWARTAVQADIREGLRRGVQGTPTFFINGEKVMGMRPVAFWEQKIRAQLQGAGTR